MPIFLALVLCATVLRAEQPKVIQANPDNGQTDVDPNTKQLRIVFDQPMDRRGFSIVGGGESFPRIIGKARWINDRTLVADIKLEPDHDYWLSINNQTFQNCRNAAGEPAVPYPISFSTAATPGATTKPDADLNRQSIQQLRDAIDNSYSYRDRLKLDWDKIFSTNQARLEQSTSPKAFARIVGTMLAPAKDMHISVRYQDTYYPVYQRYAEDNCSIKVLASIVPQWSMQDNLVATGQFPDGATYLLIATWGREIESHLGRICDIIRQADPAKGLIIDVRPNSGGGEDFAQRVAGCFVSEPVVYSKNTIRRDGKWLGPFDRVLEPNKDQPPFKGKVVVLQGKRCCSSNESFVLMMKRAGATLVGETTYGSSGNPKPHELANGVVVMLPSWNDMTPDGKEIEGVGVPPDVTVKWRSIDTARKDPVLEAGLKALKSPAPASQNSHPPR